MSKCLSAFLYLCIAFSTYAQQKKLPVYAISSQYQIDRVRDTLSPKAGGIINLKMPVVKDSIVFHYDSQNRIFREQIWRLGPNYVLETRWSQLDTSRNFIEYHYDAKNRIVAKHYGSIEGSPYRGNRYYANPTIDYLVRIMRIDSFAFDSHDKQLFFRRYEPIDKEHGYYNMQLKEGWEKEYEYDELGRMIREKYFNWYENIKVKSNYQGMYYLDYRYTYVGTTSRIRARTYYYEGPNSFFIKDSLFTYDTKGRVTGCNQFGQFVTPTYTDYSLKSKSELINKTYYFDDYGSYETVYNRAGEGKKYDKNGRLRFNYAGTTGPLIDYCEYKGFGLLGGGTAAGMRFTPVVANYTTDEDNQVLARDSVYHHNEFYKYFETNAGTGFKFDTIYYVYKTETNPITSVKDQSEKTILDVYPNPVSSEVNILTNGQAGTLNLCSIDGLIYLTQEVHDKNILLNIASLPPGLYLLELNGYRKKLVIQ